MHNRVVSISALVVLAIFIGLIVVFFATSEWPTENADPGTVCVQASEGYEGIYAYIQPDTESKTVGILLNGIRLLPAGTPENGWLPISHNWDMGNDDDEVAYVIAWLVRPCNP